MILYETYNQYSPFLYIPAPAIIVIFPYLSFLHYRLITLLPWPLLLCFCVAFCQPLDDQSSFWRENTPPPPGKKEHDNVYDSATLKLSDVIMMDRNIVFLFLIRFLLSLMKLSLDVILPQEVS